MMTIETNVFLCDDCSLFAAYGDLPVEVADDSIKADAMREGSARLGALALHDGDNEEGRVEWSTRACECCFSRAHGPRTRFAMMAEVSPDERSRWAVVVDGYRYNDRYERWTVESRETAEEFAAELKTELDHPRFDAARAIEGQWPLRVGIVDLATEHGYTIYV